MHKQINKYECLPKIDIVHADTLIHLNCYFVCVFCPILRFCNLRLRVPSHLKSISGVPFDSVKRNSSYGEGDHCPLRLSGLPAAHTFFWVIPQSPYLILPFTQWNAIGLHRHLVGCPQARNVNHCIYSDSVLLQDKVHIRIQSKKSCLQRNLFHRYCLRRNIFIKKSCLRRILFIKISCCMPNFHETKCLVIFITVGQTKVLRAGQRSINQIIIVLHAAPFVSLKSRRTHRRTGCRGSPCHGRRQRSHRRWGAWRPNICVWSCCLVKKLYFTLISLSTQWGPKAHTTHE